MSSPTLATGVAFVSPPSAASALAVEGEDENSAAPIAEEQTDGENVAQIGEEGYKTLKAAFDAVTDSTAATIKLLTNVSLTECITIGENKTITLDIGEYSITVPSNATNIWEDNKTVALFSVNGSLTIMGSGTITAKENDTYVVNVVGGTCALEGNVTYTGNISVVQVESGTLTVAGGTFKLSQKNTTVGNPGPNGDSRFLLNCIDAAYTNSTAKIEVTGGTFENFDPGNNKAEGEKTSFLKASYESKAGDDGTTYTVTKKALAETDVVAKIGAQTYESLSAAVSAASSGDTIVLQKDTSESNSVYITKSLTVDFAEHTVTLTSGCFDIYNGAEVTLKNGTLKASGQALEVSNYNNAGAAKVTIAADMTVTSSSDTTTIYVWGDGATLNVNGKVTNTNTTEGYAISGNGTNGNGGITVNINDGAAVTSSKDAAIFFPNTAALNIKGGTITGTSGIYQKSGKLTVSGGTVAANGAKAEYSYSGNGSNSTGDALVIDVCNYPGGAPQVEITGGEFTSENNQAVAVYDTQKGKSETVPTGFISGGTFSSDVSDFVAEGKECVQGTDGKYTVQANTPDTPDTPVSLTFAEITDATLYGKTASALGAFEVNTSATTPTKITVTGSAQYIDNWEQFSSIRDDQSGHYLPINIALTAEQGSYETVTVSGSKVKTFSGITKVDPTLQLVMRLDDLTDSQFTVTYGESDPYTVDVSGIILLPKAADGTKVESETKNGETVITATDSEGNVTVDLPKAVEESLSGNTIKVEQKTSFSDVDLASGTDPKVEEIIKSATIGANVSVTDNTGAAVKVEGEDIVITITIKVEAAGTYHVFCISDDKAVSSFGEYKADGTNKTITIQSHHLSQYPVVKVTAENRDAVAEAAKAVVADPGKVGDPNTPDDPTPGTKVTATYTYIGEKTESNASEYAKWGSGKLELKGLESNGTYMLQIESKMGRVYQVIKPSSSEMTMSVQGRNDLNLTMFKVSNENTMFDDLMTGSGQIFAHMPLKSGEPVSGE